MSHTEEDVALLQEGFDAYNRGDLTFALEHAADDIEVHTDPGLLNSGTYHGRDEFEQWMREWFEAWSEIAIEIGKTEIFDDRFLLVESRQRGVGAGSGVPVEMDLFQLVEVRGGKLARFHLYPDRPRALAAIERLRASNA